METNYRKTKLPLTFLLSILLLPVLITGCIKPNKYSIFSAVCTPPCWENIQPGITTKKDAFNIVNKLQIVDKDTITYLRQPNLNFDDILIFGFDSEEVVGRIYIIDNKVAQISISGDLGITLGEALDQLGEPEYVINLPIYGGPPLQGSMSSGVVLINSKLGYSISFDTREQTKGIQEEIAPETKIDLMNFFSSGIYDKLVDEGLFSFRLLNGEQTRKNLLSWEGYGKLTEKYPLVIIDNQ